MKTKVIITFLVILILSGVNSVQAGIVNPNSVVVDDIAYYLQTDKSIYSLGGEVEMLFRVTNLTENTVDIGDVIGSEPSWFHFIITDEMDNEVWHYPWQVPVLPPHLLSLEPYESIEHQEIWDMMNDNETWFGNDDFLVGLGIYNVIGELYLFSGERVPVSVSIEIIPEPSTIILLGTGLIGMIIRKRGR